jgi:DNA-binding transcriptional LysR family regulator
MVSRTRLLPPLGTLRVFEAAARHQSLVRAAEELHVTHGAVSRQIQALEDHLGERVFERRNRGIFRPIAASGSASGSRTCSPS